MSKKIHLVTGGSGFIGLNIVNKLLQQNRKVRVLDIYKSPDLHQSVEFYCCDINNDEGLKKALKNVSYVHHNVALVPLAKAGNKFWKVNVEGTKLLLKYSKEMNIEFFSHMSSSAVFGLPDKMPITEKTKTKPIEIYGKAKFAGENLVFDEIKKGFNAAIIRPRTVIGTQRLGIFQILFEWIHERRNIPIIGKGDGLFQFVHVEDLAEVSILACLEKKIGFFNIGTDDYGTLIGDLTYLCQYANKKSKVISLPVWLSIYSLKILDFLKLSPLGPWHYLTYHKPFYFDSSSAYKKLNWKPKWSNQKMLIESYDWYINNKKNKNSSEISLHKKPVKQKLLKLLKYFF